MSDPTQETQTIHAASYLDPEGSIVESARRLADGVVNGLQTHRKVGIDLVGIKGASSSYFNVFLLSLSTHLSLAEIGERISFHFSSGVQEAVFKRSLDAMHRNNQGPSESALKS